MKNGKMIYKSYVSEIQKDIKKIEKGILKEASIHVRDKIKEKLKTLGIGKKTGNLVKGIKYEILNDDVSIVGAAPPAYHAHLLEFGTVERKTKKGKRTGKMTMKPFIIPTFIEESDAVKNIMVSGFKKV